MLSREEIHTLTDIAFDNLNNEFGALARKMLNLAFEKPVVNQELTPQEVDEGQYKGKIACIKMHRNRTGMGLKDSKDAVEAYFNKLGLYFK